VSGATMGAPAATRPVERDVDRCVVQSLLRCWMREQNVPVTAAAVEVAVADGALAVPVEHASAAGWHRFGTPSLDGRPLDAAALVAVLGHELVHRHGLGAERRADLVARTLASRDRILAHAAVHGAGEPAPALTFLSGEQGLVAGHPFHPAAKSREDLDGDALEASSPELRGHLQLRWLAVDRRLVASGSALHRPAEALLGDLADRPPVPDHAVAIPAHPWQADAVLARADVADLVERGLLRDVGPHGAPWHPTSSLRTVWQPGAPWMLKLSLGARITNSRRENRRHELRLGEQAHRLLAAGVGASLAAAHPTFGVVSDPAWLGVDLPGQGLELALRQNPFPPGSAAVCVAALVDERPGCGGPRLAAVLRRNAERSGRHLADVADHWLHRYLVEVVAPLAWLDAEWGIVLEAHHQNTLVTLDPDGWPTGGWYRDSQGWYVARSAAGAARALVPDFGTDVDAVFDDDLVARRGAYYLGVNNVLGLIGALGAAGVAPEERLLSTTRSFLQDLPRSRVVDVLLHERRIPCKANLLTCADGRDELDGTVEQQSRYVDVPNPLAEVTS
jgi:siderophore synthetase component